MKVGSWECGSTWVSEVTEYQGLKLLGVGSKGRSGSKVAVVSEQN